MRAGFEFNVHRRTALGLTIVSLGGRAAWAQPAGEFRPTRMIVPGTAGSTLDLAARVLAEGLSRRRGYPIAVENRPGAEFVLGTEAFVHARPGEALLYTINAVVTVAPLMAERPLPYNPDVDLVPVHPGATDFLGLTIPDTLPVRSLAEFAARARAQPGALNWYASGLGYLAFRNFMREAGGLDMSYVAYRGSPPALLDLAAGRIQAVLTPLGAAMPLLREGRLRLLAVTNPMRSPVAPETPTAAEAGFPALQMEGAHGLFGWRGMPEAARAGLAAQVAETLAEPAAAERLRAAGMEPRAATTPMAFASELARTRAHWAALAQNFGAKPPG